jgi:signal transduction histidine kinase
VAATALVIPLTAPWATTYSGASASASLADLVAGGGLIGIGVTVLVVDGRRRIAILAILAGLAWLSADWVGWQDGPPATRTLAMLVEPLYPAFILCLLLVSPDGTAPSRRGTRGVVLSIVGLAGIALLGVLFRDPLMDPRCWANCTDDVLLVADLPFVSGFVAWAAPLAAGATGLVIVSLASLRFLRARAPERQLVWPVAVPIAFVGAGVLAHAAATFVVAHEGPQVQLYALLFQLQAWAAATLALGLAWTLVRERQRLAAVGRLARDLADAPVPGALTAALASAMATPNLELAYAVWAGAFVDAQGQRIQAPEPDDQHAVTRIVHDGRLVAIVRHDASTRDPGRLDRALGAAGKLALENERLVAVLRSRLEEARASRARIVTASATERQRLERDLHDGAQQRFLAVIHALHLARDEVREADPARAALLEGLIDATKRLINDLRDVAHGIYPATLGETGLRGALRTLTDVAPIAVELGGVPSRRLPQPVEDAVHAIVADMIERGARSGAPFLTITIRDDAGQLGIEVDGLDADHVQAIADRAAAVAGIATVEAGKLRVTIPCA